MLPAGWYPDNPDKIASFIDASMYKPAEEKGLSCIVPHAGWAFSGELAAAGIGSLKEADLFILLGGHLGPASSVLRISGDLYDTPLGSIKADTGFTAFLSEKIDIQESEAPDNTTEVLLPMIRYFHGDTPVAALRVPSGPAAAVVGKAIADYGEATETKIVVAGSTDLTHYGNDYGFTPKGTGPEAYHWVRETNDRNFIDSALAADWHRMIAHGTDDKAACSSGAAAAAAVYALESKKVRKECLKAELLGYRTSRDAAGGGGLSSFVGYAAILYR